MQNIKTFFLLLKQLMFILNSRQKKYFVSLILGSVFVGMLETLGVSVIIPFILVMLSPEKFMNNQYVRELMDMLNLTEYIQILLLVAAGVIVVYILKSFVIDRKSVV